MKSSEILSDTLKFENILIHKDFKKTLYNKKYGYEYKDYYTKCHFDKLLKSIQKYKFYSIESNQQFQHFFFIIKKENKNEFLLNLQILFNQYLPIEYTIELFNILKKKNISDIDIYNYIFSCKKRYSIDTIQKQKNINLYCEMNDYITSKVLGSFFYKYKKIYKTSFFEKDIVYSNQNIYNKIYNKSIEKKEYKQNFQYLHIGHNSNIEYFKKKLRLKNDNIYCADVKLEKDLQYQFQLIHEDGKINYPDHFFDFIYCGFILEQIPNFLKLITEIKRILKLKGFVVIYYHDRVEPLDHYIYNFHNTLEYFLNHTYSIDNFKDYQKKYKDHNYFSALQWDYIFNYMNFKHFTWGSIKNTLYYQPQFQTLSYYIFIKD